MLRILLTSAIFFMMQLCNAQQAVKVVKLKKPAEKTKLGHCFISKVVDDRSDTAGLGRLNGKAPGKYTTVVLAGGTTDAINNFIQNEVLQDPGKDTFELHLLKLEVTGKTGRPEHADLVSQIGFFRDGKKIIDYSTKGYTDAGDVSSYLGSLISQNIGEVLDELDVFWSRNKESYNDTKKSEITVDAFIKERTTDPELIVFNIAKPLTIADFEATPDKLSIALAATYSGLGLQYEVQGDNTGTRIKAEVSPYFDKTRSWMKKAGQTPYVLQHEQLHFYITAIKAYELKQAISNYKFTLAGIKEEITSLHKQYSKETEVMQAQYDEETAHGTKKDKQQLWESRIKAELQEQAAAAGY